MSCSWTLDHPGVAWLVEVVALRDIRFDGHAAVELRAGAQRMVVVHEVGPRIAWFGRGARSVLFWDVEHVHRRGDWSLRGGHRLWVTRPGADESEETYAPDNQPCRIRRLRDGVAVTSPPSAWAIEKTLIIRARNAGWTVEHRLRNTSDMLWFGGAWAVTCTQPRAGTHYVVSLDGGDPRWDAITIIVPRRWGGGHTSSLVDRQFDLQERALVIRPRGAEAKRMLWAPRGTLDMIDRKVGTFRKTAVVVPGGTYPLGTNVAVYLGPKRFMVELETMGPLRSLRPGESLRHVELWSLR